MDDPEFILSWFINPHLIWIRKAEPQPDFVRFERELDEYCRLNKNLLSQDIHKPVVGGLVAYFDRACQKWYRAVVDFHMELTSTTDSYILWLMDYGYPVRTLGSSIYKLEKRFYLPESFGNVFKVGVSNVLPASEEYDFLNECSVVEIANNWNGPTVTKLQKILESSSGIEFREKLEYDNQFFGDFIIYTNTGKILDLYKVLVKSPNAIQVTDDMEFIQKLKKLGCIDIDRFKDNNRMCVKSPEKPVENERKRPLLRQIPSSSSIASISTVPDDEMPGLVTSAEERDTETESVISKSDSYSIYSSTRSDTTSTTSTQTGKSRKLSKLLQHLNQRNMTKSTDTQSESSISCQSEIISKSPYMPSCYDQILGQEARVRSPSTSSPESSKQSKGKSRLDKILEMQKKAQKIKGPIEAPITTTTTTTTSPSTSDYKTARDTSESNSSPYDEVQSRIQKVQLATVTEIDSQEIVKCRQNVKHRDDDENFRPFVESPLVLVHGKHLSRPVYNYGDVQFTPEVIEAMKKRTPRNEIRRLQAHVWPHIMHEKSAVLVGSPGSGKTSTLIPAICSLLIRLYEDQQLPEKSGPAVIIVAAFADNVSEIQRNIRYHLNYWNERQEKSKRIIVEEAFGRHREDEIEAALLDGVGVLVVTPPCLNRMIERNLTQKMPLFTKSRLKMFVVEDFDTIYSSFGEMICDQIQHFYIKHRDSNPTQLLITSSQWETQLFKYCQWGKSPALFIANYIEASVYGKAQFRLSFSRKERKLFLLQSFLAEDIYKGRRTLVICSNDEEVNDVCNYLKDLHIIYTSYTHDTDEAGREQALSWHEKTDRHFSVLVCSDNVLGDLSKVKNVQRLFHFSLPDLWSTFSFRFSVFFDSYHDYLKKLEVPVGYETPFTQIVIDECNKSTLPRLIEFLKRVNANVPPEVEEASHQILIAREAERKSIDLCPYFLQYGIEATKCPRANCRGRHALLPCDKPSARMPPYNSYLKFKITCIHSPIHYSGQVLAYRFHNEQKWNQFEDKDQNATDVELQMQLNIYFNNFDNQRQHSNIKKGDLCGWVEPGSVWRRVQVIEVPKKPRSIDKPHKVSIRLIDTGLIYYDQSVTSLFKLSESLSNIPPRAIDVHHVGLVPYDGDKYWGSRAKNCFKYHIDRFMERKRQEDEKNGMNFYVKVYVAFRVENHIWTKNLMLCDDQTQDLVMHKILLRKNFAQRDTELKQLEVLKQMAEELGFLHRTESNENLMEGFSTSNATSLTLNDTFDSSSTLPPMKPIARSTWDYLEDSLLHPIVVYHLETPYEFTFVRIDRVKKIDDLHEMINVFMSKVENVKRLENPEKGDNCLVPMDDDYIRGRIVDVEEDVDGKFVSVFSCDFGRVEKYKLRDVFQTSNEIVEFMSYTAIMGSFSGIVVYEGDDVMNKMWKMVQKALKRGEVFAKVVHLKQNLDWLPGIYYYELVLVTRDADDNETILNQEFVRKGYAKWDKDSEETVQKMTPNQFLKDLQRDSNEESSEENWEEFVGTHKKTEVTPMPSEEGKTESDMESLAKISNELFGDTEREITFDDEEMIQMMKMFKLESFIPIYKNSKEKSESIKAIKAPSDITNDSSYPEEILNTPTNLYKTSYEVLIHTTRQPEILWQQNDSLVIISIHLGDNHDYHLEIRASTMIFAHFTTNVQLSIINFFGLINTKNVSHQIRGLNLVIRLPKRFFGIFWPRLNKEDDKRVHIKYNLDTMKALDEDFEPYLMRKRKSAERDEFIDEDSDENYCEDEVEFDDLDDPLFDGII